MAKPTFQIHRIGHRTKNQYFAGTGWGDSRYWGKGYWTAEGAFFRRTETIRKHLRKLHHGAE